jgi:hypothetical protein
MLNYNQINILKEFYDKETGESRKLMAVELQEITKVTKEATHDRIKSLADYLDNDGKKYKRKHFLSKKGLKVMKGIYNVR